MLQAMRENASSWIIKILLLAIVVAFVFMGLGSYEAQRASKIATVNEQAVSVDDYRETYNNLLQKARQQFGGNLNDEILEMMNLKKQAMDQLIIRTLILQEAEKLNLFVSNEELTGTIQDMPFFKQDDSFNVNVYEKMLKRVGLSPEQFEKDQRNQMLAQKLQQFITGSIHVSEAEAREWYDWENALVNIRMVRFDPETYTDIKPTEEEINAYFNENKNSYQTEPKVKVKYLRFSPEKYTKDIQVSKDEVQEYYENNLTAYSVEKTVEARHILIKLDENAPEELVQEAKTEAERIAKEARNGKKEFSELAKKYSQDPGRDNGGYLGKFVKNAMVQPFSDKAFSMNPGEIGDPVRTRFGWHIIKVENVFPAGTRTLAEVEAEIRQSLMVEKARNIAYDEAESFFDAVMEGDDLSIEAGSRDLEVTETDFFTRQRGPVGVGDPVKFASVAFDLPEKETSDILELEGSYYLLQVTGKTPQQIAEFQTVSEKVKNDLIQQLKSRKAAEEAEAFLKSINTDNSLADLGARKNVITTGFFKRNGEVPQAGYEKPLIDAAFQLSGEKKWPEKVIKGKTNYYVIEFIDRKKPDPEDYQKEKETVINRLSQSKRRITFDTWLTKLRAASDITIEESFR
ncbi:MAG: SurA N-terminal domain-containing protein [Pseudomonadota bacterium]